MKKNLNEVFMLPFQPYVQTTDEVERDLKGLKIAFLVWSLDISGGSNVIFQHCDFLVSRGADVTIVSFTSQKVKDWHPAMRKLRIVNIDSLGLHESFDIAVATWWRTFYEMDRIRAGTWVYFVQSVESRFYGNTTPQYAPVVAATYGLDVPVITISRWLQAYLAFEHKRPSFLVRNGIDKENFSLLGPALPERGDRRLRVLVEGPVGVDFKQTELALEILQEYRDDIEIWFLTSSHISSSDKADRVFSQVPITMVGSIMRSCDILLKLSLVEGMFGPPLEMFHCGGTSISGRVTGCEEYMIDGYNSVLVNDPTNIKEIKERLEKVLYDRELLAHLKEGAAHTASMWPNWEKSSLDFATTLLLIHKNSRRNAMSQFIEEKSKLRQLDMGGTL